LKKIAILQSNYIPWKGYFDIINKVDEFIFLDDVQYTKNDWRNRNLIKTKDGLKWLTIPVNKGYLSEKIKDKKVISTKWIKKHCHALEINYGKSRFFKEYKEIIFSLYMQARKMNFLVDINHCFIDNICKILNIETTLLTEPRYPTGNDKNINIICMCKELNASHYLTGPAARNYIDEKSFMEAGIFVEWMDYEGYPEYGQFYPPFEHGVTILDLIFHKGPKAIKYLTK